MDYTETRAGIVEYYIEVARRVRFGGDWFAFENATVNLYCSLSEEKMLKREVTGIARFDKWIEQINALEKTHYEAVWDKLWGDME